MSIADNIKKLRIEYGLTQAELGAIAGVSDKAVSTWENGTAEPRMGAVQRMADHFRITKGEIVDDPLIHAYKERAMREVAAGPGRINDEYESTNEEYSTVKIVGDSMYPILQDGDIVKVHHQTETSPTDLTVVKIDGELSTIKYLEIVSDGIWLRAENKDVFPDKHYTIQEVMSLPITVIGKAVELRRIL